MAELLVMLRDKTAKDPVIDRRGCWKRGMVITIKPDSWGWSETERRAYLVIKLPGVPEDRVSKWLRPEYDTPSGNWENTSSGRYRRRRYTINLARFTAADEDALVNEALSVDDRVAVLDKITIDEKELAVGP
jgi:hypothetical protein